LEIFFAVLCVFFAKLCVTAFERLLSELRKEPPGIRKGPQRIWTQSRPWPRLKFKKVRAIKMNRWAFLFLLTALVCGHVNASAAARAKAQPKAKKQSAAASSKVVSDREGRYAVRRDKPAQVIWGLGFEIQSDSIGSGNNGLPESPVSVPHDLVPAERTRFYKEMLKGFRYCRLALGLYLRGTDADGKRIRERYAGQMKDLLEMQHESGIEGIAPEYWSPTPYWKSNGSYTGKDGTLKSFDPEFLGQMATRWLTTSDILKTRGSGWCSGDCRMNRRWATASIRPAFTSPRTTSRRSRSWRRRSRRLTPTC
jgi:hypothetical protein